MNILKKAIAWTRFLARNPKSIALGLRLVRRELEAHPLTKLADTFGSDKGLRKHLYTRIYDELFGPMRERVKSVLEIGLLIHKDQRRLGGVQFSTAPSLKMWSLYFPNAEIYGFDIKKFNLPRGSSIKVLSGDQSKRDDLSQLKDIDGGFDIIIDDALHASLHQQVSFSYLFPLLRNGGFYVIEDLDYQPSSPESVPEIKTTLHYLRELYQYGRWSSPVALPEEKTFIEENVELLIFADSINHGLKSNGALAIIRKRS